MRYIVLFIVLTNLLSCNLTEKKYQIITIEFDKDKYTKTLCKYTLVDTGSIRTVIHSNLEQNFDGKRNRSFRIVKDRYIISITHGGIYDLKKNKFIFNNNDTALVGQLHRPRFKFVKGNNIIYNQYFFDKDTLSDSSIVQKEYSKYFSFNLNNKKFTPISNKKSCFECFEEGLPSPDKKKQILFKKDTSRYSALDFNKSYDKIFNKSACIWGKGWITKGSLSIKTEKEVKEINIPILHTYDYGMNLEEAYKWIDNEKIIATKANNQLFLIDTKSNEIKYFPKLPDISLCYGSAFSKNLGNIYYCFSDHIHKIDVENMAFEKVDRIPINDKYEKSFYLSSSKSPK